jgi:hypothetical protein
MKLCGLVVQWPRVFKKQWWRQIRRPLICPFAIWLYFATSGLQSHFAHRCPDNSNIVEHLLRFDRGCEWMSNLNSTFWDREMTIVIDLWYSYWYRSI